jgi:hypothetical protein
MKKPEVILRECVSKLSEVQLEFLNDRFQQRLSGDIPECLDLISKLPELDRWLASAQSSDEFFEMVDRIADQVLKEYNKRGSKVREEVVEV